jgi:hypothetical protein
MFLPQAISLMICYNNLDFFFLAGIYHFRLLNKNVSPAVSLHLEWCHGLNYPTPNSCAEIPTLICRDKVLKEVVKVK